MKHYSNICANFKEENFGKVLKDNRIKFCNRNCLDRESCPAYISTLYLTEVKDYSNIPKSLSNNKTKTKSRQLIT